MALPKEPEHIDIGELVEHITTNTQEVAMMMKAAVDNPINADLHLGGALNHIARILARRIILATKSGVPEETILEAIEKGSPYEHSS